MGRHDEAHRRPAELSPWLRVRLVLDRLVAVGLGLLSAPVVAVLAALIRRDGGPGLIRVPRVGRHGKVFGMWKLRSMRADTGGGLAKGAAITLGEHDPRITTLGRHLRAYHLDELPQLWNVAAGQMCLLGPRPEAPEYVADESPAWSEILNMPPGMAGPTQLIVGDWERELLAEDPDNAYSDVVLPVKLAIDQWYLRSSSPATDILVSLTLLRRFTTGSESWKLRERVFSAIPESSVVRDWLSANDPAPAPQR